MPEFIGLLDRERLAGWLAKQVCAHSRAKIWPVAILSTCYGRTTPFVPNAVSGSRPNR